MQACKQAKAGLPSVSHQQSAMAGTLTRLCRGCIRGCSSAAVTLHELDHGILAGMAAEHQRNKIQMHLVGIPTLASALAGWQSCKHCNCMQSQASQCVPCPKHSNIAAEPDVHMTSPVS